MLHNTLRLLLWNRTLVFNNNTSARRVSLTESGSSNKFDRFDTFVSLIDIVKKRDQQKSVSNLFIAAFSTRKLFPFYNIHDPRIHLFSSRISKQIWQPQPEWNTQNLVHQLHILLYIRIYRFVMLLQTGCIL